MDQQQTDRPNAGDVRRLCGDLSDSAVLAILGTGATTAELEAASAWAGAAEGVDDGGHFLSPAAAAVLTLLELEAGEAEER